MILACQAQRSFHELDEQRAAKDGIVRRVVYGPGDVLRRRIDSEVKGVHLDAPWAGAQQRRLEPEYADGLRSASYASKMPATTPSRVKREKFLRLRKKKAGD